MDHGPDDEIPSDESESEREADRRIEKGGFSAFRADPRPAGEKMRPLLNGYFANSQLMAYLFIFGGIAALLVVAVLFRLFGLAPG